MQTAVRFVPELPVIVNPTYQMSTTFRSWWGEYGMSIYEYDKESKTIELFDEGWRITILDYIPGVGGTVLADRYTWERQIPGLFVWDTYGDPEEFAYKVLRMLTIPSVRNWNPMPKMVWD